MFAATLLAGCAASSAPDPPPRGADAATTDDAEAPREEPVALDGGVTAADSGARDAHAARPDAHADPDGQVSFMSLYGAPPRL